MYAETRVVVSAEKAPLTYRWEGYGLNLHVPEGATASFSIKAVWSSSFELPDETELVSPVFLVSCEGKFEGPVGVELQHCARVRKKGQKSGLSFVVCKVKRPKPPYQFELVDGQFSSSSSYGKVEVNFCRRIMAVTRQRGQNPDPMFQAKLYYQQKQQSKSLVHFVIVPKLDISIKVGEVHNNYVYTLY